MLKKPITTEFFSTLSIQHFYHSLYSLTLRIYKLRKGSDIGLLENDLIKYMGIKDSKIVSFYNGRSAIFKLLQKLNLKNTDEVIVNGYNCISVSNAVIQSGLRPIYCDINKNDLAFDIEKFKNSISINTKAVIIQHTFGKPANLDEILKLCNDKGLLIIEDIAHALGSEYNRNKLGTFGDFAIISTGRDKVINSVNGGFLVINNSKYFNLKNSIKKELIIPSICTVIKNHNYNIFGYIAYKTYNFIKLGIIIMYLSKKIGIFPSIINNDEKICNYKKLNYSLPNSLAYLARKQLKEIDKINNHRINIAKIYNSKLNPDFLVFSELKNETNNYFRFPIIIKNKEKREQLIKQSKQKGIYLGTSWSGINITPIGSDIEKAGYIMGTCVVSEDISQQLILLPNHINITEKECIKIINLVNKYV